MNYPQVNITFSFFVTKKVIYLNEDPVQVGQKLYQRQIQFDILKHCLFLFFCGTPDFPYVIRRNKIVWKICIINILIFSSIFLY